MHILGWRGCTSLTTQPRKCQPCHRLNPNLDNAFPAPAKHGVLIVQPGCGDAGDEELRAIGAGAGGGGGLRVKGRRRGHLKGEGNQAGTKPHFLSCRFIRAAGPAQPDDDREGSTGSQGLVQPRPPASPALAMLRMPGRSCRRVLWNSSSNSPPQMDSPPVPSPTQEEGVRVAHSSEGAVHLREDALDQQAGGSHLTGSLVRPHFSPSPPAPSASP